MSDCYHVEVLPVFEQLEHHMVQMRWDVHEIHSLLADIFYSQFEFRSVEVHLVAEEAGVLIGSCGHFLHIAVGIDSADHSHGR